MNNFAWYEAYQDLNTIFKGELVEPTIQKFLDKARIVRELAKAKYKVNLRKDLKKVISKLKRESKPKVAKSRSNKMSCIDRSKVNTPKSFPGQKSMSTARMPKASGGSGSGPINRSTVNTPKSFPGQKSMSSKRGVVNAKPTSGLVHPEGRVGAGTKSFSGTIKQGPCNIGSGKGSYSPHKSKA